MEREEINKIKEKCIVIDIETSSMSPDGQKIDIRTDFDLYVKYMYIQIYI